MWLITGASGYIGSHVAMEFLKSGARIVCVDNLSTGKKIRNQELGIEIKRIDIRDFEVLETLFKTYDFDGVINIAGLKSPTESFLKPEEYFDVNAQGVRNLTSLARKFNVNFFIQSSSSSVYGQTNESLIREDAKLSPISPYGRSKLEAEEILQQSEIEGGPRYVALRYFNVVGSARPELKDDTDFNLFPATIRKLQMGLPPVIYGKGFNTFDGTCIRDYIHVEDLAELHFKLAKKLQDGCSIPKAINLGNGKGYSVLQVVEEMMRMMRLSIPIQFQSPRNGDPSIVVGNVQLLKSVLGDVKMRSLQEMISSAL